MRPLRREREHGPEAAVDRKSMEQPVQCASVKPKCRPISDLAR
jgi:hypothetical protein